MKAIWREKLVDASVVFVLLTSGCSVRVRSLVDVSVEGGQGKDACQYQKCDSRMDLEKTPPPWFGEGKDYIPFPKTRTVA